VEVTFELTEDDLVAFHRAQRTARFRRAREAGRRKKGPSWVVFGVAFGVALVVVFTDMTWTVLTYLGLVLLGVVLVFVWALTVNVPKKLVKQFLNDGRNFRQLQRRTVTTTTEGIRQVTRDYSTTATWAGIDWIESTPSHVFFFLNTIQALIVPRAAFASEEEFKVFVEEVRRWHEAATLQEAAPFRPTPATQHIEKE
jgi:hypothetical protein